MSENVAEYVLPLRRADREGETELLAYLQWLSERMEVTVVDGSDAALFRHLHERLPTGIRPIPPHRPGLNGKARGVMTAFDVARRERIVLADDDVRYDEDSLNALLARLESADLVRPQNVYASYPWHAQWDTARMLVGRALGGDYGGTVGVRRSASGRAVPSADHPRVDAPPQLERTDRADGCRHRRCGIRPPCRRRRGADPGHRHPVHAGVDAGARGDRVDGGQLASAWGSDVRRAPHRSRRDDGGIPAAAPGSRRRRVR
jgi:hypothetical protein